MEVKMKFLIPLFLIWNSISALADDDLGRHIEFVSKDDKPQFGVQFADKMAALTFSVVGADLSESSISKLEIQLVNRRTGKVYTKRKLTQTYPEGGNTKGTQAFSMDISDANINELRAAVIVFQADGPN